MMILIHCLAALLFSWQSLFAGARASAEPIGVTTFSWQDDSRDRPIVVECWYPTDALAASEPDLGAAWLHPKEARNAVIRASATKMPLIIMSHGYGRERRDQSWLAERLVKKGFVVAAVDHYGNTQNTLDHTATVKFWDRPKDVSFVIDHLLQEPLLQNYLDVDHIGFVGYSLSGMTGLSLSGASAIEVQEALERQKQKFASIATEIAEDVDLSPAAQSGFEPRIKAILLLAPATWCFNHPESFQSIRTPIAIVGTTSDELLAFDEHLKPLIQHSVPRRLKLLRNGTSHFSFLNISSKVGQKLLPPRMAFDPAGIKREKVHEEVGTFAVEFFSEYLQPKPN